MEPAAEGTHLVGGTQASQAQRSDDVARPTEARHHDPGTSRKGALFRVLQIAGP